MYVYMHIIVLVPQLFTLLEKASIPHINPRMTEGFFKITFSRRKYTRLADTCQSPSTLEYFLTSREHHSIAKVKFSGPTQTKLQQSMVNENFFIYQSQRLYL